MTDFGIAAAALLAFAALVSALRYLRSDARARYLLAALQPVAAVLLYFALFAPAPRGDAELIVLTAGVTPEQLRAVQSSRTPYVALPEADAPPGGARAPDLAAALRAHAGTTRVRVLGTGLPARDVDAAQGVSVRFDPPPAPRGIVALSVDAPVVAGRVLHVAGGVAGVEGGTIELRDPADAVIGARPLDAGGAFAFEARASQPGPALYRLRVVDARAAEVESLAVPVDVRAGAPLHVGVLGGGVGPELKYLRRHLVDAGFVLRSRLGLSVGIELRDAPLALDAAALRGLDVLVADDRGWAAAGRAERAAIVEAVRGGLGLLLRATGPLPAGVAEAWGTLGLVHEPVESHTATLALGTGPEAPPALTLLPLRATSPMASPLPLAGRAAGWWLPHDRGRVALWRLIDSHRLVTAGHAPRHAELWAGVLETLARPRGGAPPRLDAIARAGERLVLCGVAANATIVAPDGTMTALVPVDRGAHGRCAAYWPRAPGWHGLREAAPATQAPAAATDAAATGTPAADAETHRVFVHARDAAPALAAAKRAADTRRLAARGADREAGPTSAWPGAWAWWAAWLSLIAACWWLERRTLAAGAP